MDQEARPKRKLPGQQEQQGPGAAGARQAGLAGGGSPGGMGPGGMPHQGPDWATLMTQMGREGRAPQEPSEGQQMAPESGPQPFNGWRSGGGMPWLQSVAQALMSKRQAMFGGGQGPGQPGGILGARKPPGTGF